MIRCPRHPSWILAITLASAAAGSAWAGPPGLCHPLSIGDAPCLEWGKDTDAFDSKIKGAGAVEQALALLNETAPVVVRMETIRRAAVSFGRDQRLAREFVSRLVARALDAEAAGSPNAVAYFDAGYAAQCVDQWAPSDGPEAVGVARGIVGYAYLAHAIELNPKEPGFEFGAGIASLMADPALAATHFRSAKSGAAPGSLLARNVERQMQVWDIH